MHNVNILYSRTQKVRLKQWGLDLWSEMALLTDNKFETVEACQGGSTGLKIIPLYHS